MIFLPGCSFLVRNGPVGDATFKVLDEVFHVRPLDIGYQINFQKMEIFETLFSFSDFSSS